MSSVLASSFGCFMSFELRALWKPYKGIGTRKRAPVQLPFDFGPAPESLTAHARRAKAALSGHSDHDNIDLPPAPPKNADQE